MVTPRTASTKQHIYDMEPVAAPLEQQADVTALHHLLEQESATNHLQLVTASGRTVSIPESVFWILERVTQVMANGDAVTVVPVNQALTVQQAANILNVSSQYLAQLLMDDQIPVVQTEAGHRIRIEELLKYKNRRDQARAEALDELADLSQQYGGYTELNLV